VEGGGRPGQRSTSERAGKIEGRLASGEARTKEGTMSNDTPDTERRPRPGGETRFKEERSLTHAAATAYVVATATGVGLASGHELVQGVKGAASKVKDALTPSESTIELPPGTEK
jgi:hypothetical protein